MYVLPNCALLMGISFQSGRTQGSAVDHRELGEKLNRLFIALVFVTEYDAVGKSRGWFVFTASAGIKEWIEA
ncbi:unnamed protein product [Haemonchus placei]|uniref:PH domain-containing protein n=1 Tax=Haemonchus placei TaxID=6290 RepID=A0A0N4X9R8_HAEPC|nr:unnamed protein product [Haemonchus placei]